MFDSVSIENYKSIKNIEFNAKRINIFLGEPNAGKSNILEAMALLSVEKGNFKEVLRYKSHEDLFYNFHIGETVFVQMGSYNCTITSTDTKATLSIYDISASSKPLRRFTLEKNNITVLNDSDIETAAPIRFYKFKNMEYIEDRNSTIPFLSTPFGSNLYAMLTINKQLRINAAKLFEAKNFRFELRGKGKDKKIELGMDFENEITPIPLELVSDTLRRVLFYEAVFVTNTNSTILLEEPEAHTFPYYTKQLAEKICFDESGNQFFIITHNPYLLLPLVEKTSSEDLAVFVVKMEDFQTKVYPVTQEGIREIIDEGTDAFLNLDRIIE